MTPAVDNASDDGDAMGKAQQFFDRARDVADAGNFDYAIELFLHGMSLVPDDVAAHKELRLIALERRARGGNDMSRFEKIKLRDAIAGTTEARKVMLLAERMLAFDPGNPEWIKCCNENARRANLVHAAAWFARLEAELSCVRGTGQASSLTTTLEDRPAGA